MSQNSKNCNSRHVVPNPNGGWDNKKCGNERATSHHDTKADAEKVAREQSKREGSELVIHRKDGTIERKDSHGNDPSNIPG